MSLEEQKAGSIQSSDRALESKSMSKYLTFVLGRETYGLEIVRVREIIGLMEITTVPRMPAFVRGVINLRGRVVPVVDLRIEFGMKDSSDTAETCIIVVDLGSTYMGVVVDKVSEVLDVADADVEPTPSFGVDLDTSFILGIGKTKGKVVILLDICKVLTGAETAMDIPAI